MSVSSTVRASMFFVFQKSLLALKHSKKYPELRRGLENTIQKRSGTGSVKNPLATCQIWSGIPLASSRISIIPR